MSVCLSSDCPNLWQQTLAGCQVKDAQTAVEALIAAAEPLKPEAAAHCVIAIIISLALTLAITITITTITVLTAICYHCF